MSSPLEFPQDPPSRRELPFAIHQRATPNAPRGMDPESGEYSGMFPDDHYPIREQLHKPSPSEFSYVVDPYAQTAQMADLLLQQVSKDGQAMYQIENVNQNVPYKMEPLVSNGDSARGNQFSMNWDQLEEYRKREYTVELPTTKPGFLNPEMSYIDTNDRYYPYPGFFLQKDPSYYTYPQPPNYYGTAPITGISFGAVNPKQFYYQNQQNEGIEQQFSSKAPNAFLESFENLKKENEGEMDPYECSQNVYVGIWVILMLIILLCLFYLWKK